MKKYLFCTFLTIALSCYCSLVHATAKPITFYGSMVYSSAWTQRSLYGIYSFYSDHEGFTEESPEDGAVLANGGGIFSSDMSHYYAVTINEFLDGTATVEFNDYNTSNWEPTRTVKLSDSTLVAIDLTRDRRTDEVFGIFYSKGGSTCELGKLDYNTLTRTTIGTPSTDLVAIAADGTGKLYGIGTDGALYEVNRTDASLKRIGNTGVKVAGSDGSFYLQSATFDTTTNNMYWTAYTSDGTSCLYTIDTSTGKATLMRKFPNYEMILNLEVGKPLADDKAPAAISELNATFSGVSLKGAVSFTTPNTTFEGSLLTGNLTYHIIANGNEIASGLTQPGIRDSISVKVPKSGQYTFQVYVTNSVGDGPRNVKTTRYVGYDVPKKPTSVKLTQNKNEMCVSWWLQNSGIHNMAINRDSISFNLVRYPDGKIIKDVKSLTYTDTVPEGPYTYYYYEVTANGGEGLISEPATSNGGKYGYALTVPYSTSFDTENDFYLWDVIDNNKDNQTWYWTNYDSDYHNGAVSGNSSSHGMDDYLVSPPLQMLGGKTYRLSFKARIYDEKYHEFLQVAYAPENGELLKDTIIFFTDSLTQKHGLTTFTATFTPKVDNDYCIIFCDNNEGDYWRMKITDVSITAVDYTGIKPIGVEPTLRVKGIYTISGVYMGTNKNLLAPGFYIIDGKKVFINGH